ncbi:MAG: hypothetical protein GTO51_01520 [Candidatus Latescibacteria bacterium]|nr:hypothetical protein [Candidatus Latescibacterota bacterium]NIM22106.1 hypothetical protein [Candidatus Latescibacterota bacterium]NIM64656.1 hypothetical protein [Candidatus Latescibacterota bacterium]NIO01166.1 hypothetical protein [Candidatus Latescibacterota bacterium]NIO27551.1 hypothetical protein [Candidatus Latescibacterota bacterium]
MYKVLLTDNLAEEALNVFTRYPDIEAVRTATLAKDELLSMIPEFDAIIVRSPTRITKEILGHASNLKIIGRAGVGTDNIDVEEATKREIVVMNASSGNAVSTAEHTIGLMLSLARKIPQAHQSVTEGKWDRDAFRGTELQGKTLGIVGLGRIGREVAKRAKAFEMNVIAADPYIEKEMAEVLGVRLVDLETLLSISHFVTIHVPLSPETKGLISEKEISLMLEGAYLINCSRGGIIDEAAASEACRSGKLAGVACDVYLQEPPAGEPLLLLDGSVFTPHIGGATREAQIRVAVDISVKVAEALVNGVIRGAINSPSGASGPKEAP